MLIHIQRLALQMLTRRVASGTRKASDQLILRVATRHIRANMKVEYDRMLRLQVLEGAGHVPAGTWWKHGVRGLAKAKAHFEGQGVQPLWFDAGYSGMFPVIERTLKMIIGKNPSIHGTDVLDIINAALMGIPMDASDDKDRVLPAYNVGKHLAPKMLSGEETPESVGKGLLGKFMVRRVLDYVRHKKNETSMGTDDDGVPMDIEDKHDGVPAWQFFAGLLFKGTDPLSRKLQGLMQETWARSPGMTLWLNKVRETGEFPRGSDIADEIGINKGTFSQKHWTPYWTKFLSAVWSDAALHKALSDRMTLEGVDGDLPEAFHGVMDKADK